MSRVLVIGDTHAPAMHKNYIPFLKEVAKKWKTDKVIHVGDVIDHHCISFHDKHPNNPGPIKEHELAMAQIKKLHKEFPHMVITIGNHDKRVQRLNAKMGIPDFYLKEFNATYGTNSWKWVEHTEIDDVFYYHGEGAGGGQHPAFAAAKMRMQSTVIGHYHSCCGIWYQAGPTAKIWGMNVGCGVDRNHWAMDYGAAYLKKPIVSCGVVIEGAPFIETMNL